MKVQDASVIARDMAFHNISYSLFKLRLCFYCSNPFMRLSQSTIMKLCTIAAAASLSSTGLAAPLIGLTALVQNAAEITDINIRTQVHRHALKCLPATHLEYLCNWSDDGSVVSWTTPEQDVAEIVDIGRQNEGENQV